MDFGLVTTVNEGSTENMVFGLKDKNKVIDRILRVIRWGE